MFNTRLIRLVPDALKYICFAVFFNWTCLLFNIIVTFTVCHFLNLLYFEKNVSIKTFFYSATIILFCSFFRILFIRLSSLFANKSSQNAKKILRGKIYKKLTDIGTSYNQQVSTSEALQISVEGIDQLEIYFGSYLPQLFYSFFAPITLFIVVSFLSLKSAIILLICVPLIPISIIAVQKLAKRLLAKYWDTYTTLGDTFLENIQGLTTLKIYNADEKKHKEMNENAEAFRKITMRVLIMQLNSISVMDFVAYGGAAAGIITALISYKTLNLSLFSMIAIILLSADFFIPMRQLGSFFHVALNGMTAADKLFNIIDLPIPSRGACSMPLKNDIFINNLFFSYEESSFGLKNISINIPEKTFCCIVGKSGCGKSTIAGILSGRLKGYSGSIKIDKTELNDIFEKDLSKNITIVTHNSYIFQGTIEENLKMGNENASQKEMEKALSFVNLLEFVNSKDGLKTKISEQGQNLSGGQRQRLAIARALLKDSPIYIFDESTSSIDMESEEIIMSAIKKIAKTKTIILITHRLANTEEADLIYILENGETKESGSFLSLLSLNGIFSNLYNQQKELENFSNGGI